MELGNFLGKLKGEKKAEPKKFLALVLTDEVVQSAVWQVQNEQTEIVAVGTPVEWDGDIGTTTELVTAVDATISSAIEGLEADPTEVILGVPHTWTDKSGILGVKREFIKTISKELELKTLGFVVISDSILSYLKMQEGTPTTSIMIQVSRDELTLILVRLGRIEAIETIGRSDDVVDDVTEGITRFKLGDNLPSRIILFNSMHNLEEIIQNLLSVDWQSQFNFLHTPKIEALGKDVAIRALAVAGGAEVAKSLGFSVSDQTIDVPVLPESDSKGEIDESDSKLLTAEEIGFTSSVVEAKSKIDFIDPEDAPPTTTSVGVDPRVDPPSKPSKPKTPFVMPKLKLPTLTLPTFKFNLTSTKPLWWYLGGGLLLFGLLVFYLIWILPKATITAQVAPKILEQDVNLTLSTLDSTVEFADLVVPAKLESLVESGEKIIETTGKKIVGEAAEGQVTIYNRTSSTKIFPKGTTLSVSGLKFTLDSDVTVASKSAGVDYVDVPGKASVGITAAAIGTEGNMASGTEFTIASFGKDSYVAKNDATLSGGTSEEVQVVGKDDQSELVKSLTTELLQTLEAQAKSNTSPGTGAYLIPDSAKVDSATYSAKTGETAKSLTLNLTVKVSLLKYKTEDVATLVNSAIDAGVPSGFVRANLPSVVDLSASSVSEDETSVKGKAKVKISLLPVLDTTAITSAVKGLKPTAIGDIMRAGIPGFTEANVEITPRFIPTKLKMIPLNPKNIQLEVVPVL